jgi:hypothetical protein
VFVSASALGQSTYERVLVPIVANGVPGGYGSIWQTMFAGFNPTGQIIAIKHTLDEFCAVPPCLGAPAQPHTTFGNEVLTALGHEGEILFVQVPGAESLQFNLRIFDRAHPRAAWGAEVPVVRERQVTGETLHLLNVVLDPVSRAALRVYGINNRAASVLVRATRTDVPFVEPYEFSVILQSTPSRAFGTFPSFGIVPDLSGVVPASWTQSQIRLEIAAPPDEKIWAFVSITNNETQGITISSPSK